MDTIPLQVENWGLVENEPQADTEAQYREQPATREADQEPALLRALALQPPA